MSAFKVVFTKEPDGSSLVITDVSSAGKIFKPAELRGLARTLTRIANDADQADYPGKCQTIVYNLLPDQPEPDHLTAENQRLRELLNTAAGLLYRLEQYHYINTDDDESEAQLDHWRDIGRTVVKQARTLLNQ